MNKRRVPHNAIVLKGLVFKLGIRTVVGRVVEQNGAVCFACDQEGIYSLLPFRVAEENYNQSVEAWIRTYDQSLVFKLGPDDLPIERMDENKHYFDVTSLEPIDELFERCLTKRVPLLVSSLRYALGSSLVAVLLWLLRVPVFPFVTIPAALAVYDIGWFFANYRMLNQRIIYDAVGNWINLSSGVTSLNFGSFQFDFRRK